ncbi:DNA repair protein RecO [Fusibacter bizertensis]
MYLETDALVIKTTKTLNNDLFLTLYSRKAGKIEVVANGAKSSKSQLSASSKPFVYGHFSLNTHNKVTKVISSEIIDSHYRIADHLETLAYGNYFIELCNLVTMPNMIDVQHFQLIVEIMTLLSNSSKSVGTDQQLDYELLKLSYLIKLSVITGHQANLQYVCTSCSGQENVLYFSTQAGGLICKNCEGTLYKGVKLNETYLKLIHYLTIKDIRVIMKTKIHENYVIQLNKIYEDYIMFHNNITEIRSKSFLKSIGE